jgi:hypothetical protein
MDALGRARLPGAEARSAVARRRPRRAGEGGGPVSARVGSGSCPRGGSGPRRAHFCCTPKAPGRREVAQRLAAAGWHADLSGGVSVMRLPTPAAFPAIDAKIRGGARLRIRAGDP